MEQYSVEFFTSFVEHLQDACRNYLNYSQFVEVSGYVCVEIDNRKKERYVLSELLQSSGNIVSESYCTKAFQTSRSDGMVASELIRDRNKENSWMDHSQSRDVTLIESNQHLSVPSARRSRSNFTSGTTSNSEVTRAQEKHISLIQRHNSYQVETQYKAPGFTDNYSTTSTEAMSIFPQDDEVIDLDSLDDDFDLPESMDAANSEGFSETASVSEFSLEKKSSLSPGTLATVRNSVKQFRRFHFDKHGEVDLLSTSPEKLNQLLLEYFKGGKKMSGGALNANTLKSVQKHLDMFLKDKGYPYSIGKSKHFQASREYLKKKLDEIGKVVAQTHTPVNDDDIEKLFQTNQLGIHNPDSLINTLWFLNSKYFGIRRPAEHFNMKWGDIHLKVNDQGQEYLERPIHGTFSLKVLSKPDAPDRCFVHFYKQYRAMRPKITLDESFPFYLKSQKNSDVWFLPEQVMYSSFTYIWRKIVSASGLPFDKKIF